jgi:hypothetical protein
VSAATLTPAETVREAHALLHEVMAMPGRRAVADEAIALARALGAYKELDGDALRWDATGPEPAGDAEGELAKAAGEVQSAAHDLMKVIAAHGGSPVGDKTKTMAGAE